MAAAKGGISALSMLLAEKKEKEAAVPAATHSNSETKKNESDVANGKTIAATATDETKKPLENPKGSPTKETKHRERTYSFHRGTVPAVGISPLRKAFGAPSEEDIFGLPLTIANESVLDDHTETDENLFGVPPPSP